MLSQEQHVEISVLIRQGLSIRSIAQRIWRLIQRQLSRYGCSCKAELMIRAHLVMRFII
jgi:hypothetical protein